MAQETERNPNREKEQQARNVPTPPTGAGQEESREARTQREYQQREQSNNPATAKYRQYDEGAPGMHPANLPADRLNGEVPLKGTRLDLEDVTGNPGHRGVNPDAPAFSINPGPNVLPSAKENEALAKMPHIRSINEPVDVEPLSRAQQLGTPPLAGQGSMASINEPPGSTIGSNAPGAPPAAQPPVLTGISPESITLTAATAETFSLMVTGTGFNEDSVIVFDDEDLETTFVSETQLTAEAPTSTVAKEVDVEVTNGDDLSDAITFEYIAAEADASRTGQRKAPQRKPSKGKRPAEKRKTKKR